MSEIVLYGSVGASFWGEDHFTARQVMDQLRQASGPLTVRINSGGGVADEGAAIYNALRDYPGEVQVVVDGAAASAASLIAMAGDRVTVRRGGFLLIHDPAALLTEGRGTEEDHLTMARKLRVISGVYADVYAARAGISKDEAREIMRADTVLDGEAAVMMGFADSYDEETEAAIAARFDYRIYAHAPEAALKASESIGAVAPGRVAAVVAMMAGVPAQPRSEIMTEHTVETAAEVTSVDDEISAVETPPAAEEPTQATARGDTIAERTRVRRILDTVAAAGLPVTLAQDLIDKGTPADEAATIILRKWKEAGDVDTPMPGRPTAQILRDERDTRRAGMEGAIVARMSGAREVSGPARDFMAFSVAEMAAASMGHTGRLGRGADSLRQIEMAFGSHSTSDLPAIFENALNKRLLAAYAAAQPSYRTIAQRMDFMDFRPHPISGVGDWPTLLPVGEGGEIKFGTVGDKKETVTLVPYARGLKISRQMIVNDDLGAIDRILQSRGRAVAAFEEQTFYAMFLSGSNANGPTLLETNRQVYNTTDKTLAGTPTAITPDAVGVGIAAMRTRKGVSGEAFLTVEPRILLTGPDKEFEALQLLAPIQAAQASNVNPYVGRMSNVTSSYVTGNAWYLFASPADVPAFMYGFLEGEAGPRMRMEEPFGQQGVGFTVELDFGVGAIDYRGTYRNAGA